MRGGPKPAKSKEAKPPVERAGRRSIALPTNIDSRVGQVQADERKIRQVVLNLLSNVVCEPHPGNHCRQTEPPTSP
jgi:nitrogen-specific signal transduction histidine kinase